jgi:hypothetical protein
MLPKSLLLLLLTTGALAASEWSLEYTAESADVYSDVVLVAALPRHLSVVYGTPSLLLLAAHSLNRIQYVSPPHTWDIHLQVGPQAGVLMRSERGVGRKGGSAGWAVARGPGCLGRSALPQWHWQ